MRAFIMVAVFIVASAAVSYSQNEIDFVQAYYVGGYQKPAVDADTLYLCVLNGQGVERYYLGNPSQPEFIDRQVGVGFDVIDFGRRLMLRLHPDRIDLIDFTDFANAQIVSSVLLPSPLKNEAIKVNGDYLFFATQDDTLRVYDIAELTVPTHVGSSVLQGEVIIGTAVAIAITYEVSHYFTIRAVYSILSPDSAVLAGVDTLLGGPISGLTHHRPARGDTLLRIDGGITWGECYMEQFFPDGTSQTYAQYSFNNAEVDYFRSENSYLLRWYVWDFFRVYSFNTLGLLGRLYPNGPGFGIQFEFYNDNYLFLPDDSSLSVFEAPHSDTSMPLVYYGQLEHHGIVSSYCFMSAGMPLLLNGSDAGSGELLIHLVNESGDLQLISTVENVEARRIVAGDAAFFCMGDSSISAVDISNPYSPYLLNQVQGFDHALLDFDLHDNIVYAITDRTYYVISYGHDTGFLIISSLNFQEHDLTSIAQQDTRTWLLKGEAGLVAEISADDPANPYVAHVKTLSQDYYQNVELIQDSTIWASGPSGTDVFSTIDFGDITFLGPEYFSDVTRLHAVSETLYVADGINGIRVFDMDNFPVNPMRFIGSYRTGNKITYVAKHDSNFYVSDYYSLQQLRWGAPTAVDEVKQVHLPTRIALDQNFPNPFNAATAINYSLPQSGQVDLTVYNVLGQRVVTLFEGLQPAGKHKLIWNAGDLPSGVYFARLQSEGRTQTVRMVLLK